MKRLHRISFIMLILIGSTVELMAQDWANLERYKKANLNLEAPAPGKIRVVLMGNSITEGWPKFYPEFFENSPYLPRGISGQTTPQMLLRFRQDVIDLEPDVVVILAGTNDIAGNTGPMTLDEIYGYIVSMSELAHANNIKVILASVLPVYQYTWRKGIQPAEQIVALNDMLQAYASAGDIYYLDYFTTMADKRNGFKDEYTYDGVHPNRAGYVQMSKLLAQAIKEAIKSP